MFNKKKCSKCASKVDKSFEFCPTCGNRISIKKPEDWGMLGKDDFSPIQREKPKMPLIDRLAGNLMDKVVGSAMKAVEKEMKKEMKNIGKMPKTNFRLMVNGREIPINQVKQTGPIKKENAKKKKNFPQSDLSGEEKKRMKILPKKEPEATARRIGDRVIYEIELPEVKSVSKISINQLENSIEIKALGKKNVYYKVLPLKMSINDYYFSKEVLTLELDVE